MSPVAERLGGILGPDTIDLPDAYISEQVEAVPRGARHGEALADSPRRPPPTWEHTGRGDPKAGGPRHLPYSRNGRQILIDRAALDAQLVNGKPT